MTLTCNLSLDLPINKMLTEAPVRFRLVFWLDYFLSGMNSSVYSSWCLVYDTMMLVATDNGHLDLFRWQMMFWWFYCHCCHLLPSFPAFSYPSYPSSSLPPTSYPLLPLPSWPSTSWSAFDVEFLQRGPFLGLLNEADRICVYRKFPTWNGSTCDFFKKSFSVMKAVHIK